MLKRKDIAEGIIERVDYPNRGRIHTEEGQKVTVKNTIPGQKVRFRVFKKHQDRVEGHLLEVLEKSPLETREPLCAIFPQCGGCLSQTLPYETQLRLKADQVNRLLSEVTDGAPFDGILPSPTELAYRNKMEFSFGDDRPGGPLTLGLHRRNTTYDVLTADTCRLVHPDMTTILRATLDYCTEANLPKYNKRDHVGFLRFLLLRRSVTTGELLVYLVTSSQEPHDFTPWAERLKALPIEGTYAGIFHAYDDNKADAVKVDSAKCLFGRDWFYEELLGLTFKVTAFSFFQTNTKGAELLYDAVRKYVTGGTVQGLFASASENETPSSAGIAGSAEGRRPVLYDLYSGTGTIAQVLAPVAGNVYGIELIPEAVEAAKENAALNGIENCTFLAGDVFEKLGEIEERPDYIILDPPREGILPKSLSKIISYGVNEMVYISCKASSFKSDMAVLRDFGFRVKRWCLVDMFPETQHVCLLTHSGTEEAEKG